MRVIYTSKGMSKKFWGARYTLGALYLSKNTVVQTVIAKPEHTGHEVIYFVDVCRATNGAPTVLCWV